MNADAYFTIGKEHAAKTPFVCQDYAAVMGPGRVVLADGCSSSRHTDFGARLLCRLGAQLGPNKAPRAAEPILATLGLPTQCLDATLLLARWREEEQDVRVLLAGDGVVVARRRSGGYFLVLSEFPSGAPRYLSYDLDPARRAQYVQEFGGVQKITTTYQGGVTEQVFPLLDEDLAVPEFTFPAAEFDLVLVMSDGATSFQRPKSADAPWITEPVPLVEVVEEMLAIKGYAGVFVAKRALRFLKDAHAKGWHHSDDFAVAGIYLDDV